MRGSATPPTAWLPDGSAPCARIAGPTLVVTMTGRGLGSAETERAWQERTPGSRLGAIESDSDHVAASDADQVAGLVRVFLLDDNRG
jgi:hypothetical protein